MKPQPPCPVKVSLVVAEIALVVAAVWVWRAFVVSCNVAERGEAPGVAVVLADPKLIAVADSDGLGLRLRGWLGGLVVGRISLAALAERIRVERQAVVVGRFR